MNIRSSFYGIIKRHHQTRTIYIHTNMYTYPSAFNERSVISLHDDIVRLCSLGQCLLKLSHVLQNSKNNNNNKVRNHIS